MSFNWIVKMAASAPRTLQEERVREVLIAAKIPHRIHEVFTTGRRFVIVDFFLSEANTVVECWISRSRRGEAVGWMEKNAAYMDLKFRRLKQEHHDIRCVALAEAPQVDSLFLEEIVGGVLIHADSIAYSVGELEQIMRGICPPHAGAIQTAAEVQ